jgi:TetR/AcrR family tetracycline transcriptional repressor
MPLYHAAQGDRQAMRATILRHRDIVRNSIGRIPMGPNALHYSERTFAVMRAGGVPDPFAVTGQHLLFAVVNGFTIDETLDLGVEGAAPVDENAANLARDYIAALPVDQFPNIVAVADNFAFVDNDWRFALLIDLYVDGLAQRVPQ